MRRGGGGLRKRQGLAAAAFVGTLSAVAPSLIDPDALGVTRRGFAPCLESLFGCAAFDGREDRFSFLLRDQQGRLGNELERCWDTMQSEVALSAMSAITSGPLLVPAACAGWSGDAGAVIPKLQKALTEQREDAAVTALNRELALLNFYDPRRASFASLDRFSNSIITAMPTRECAIANEEFSEIIANHFGVDSPACARRAGQPIARASGAVLDRHGRVLMNDPRLLNLGNARTHWHDSCLHHLADGLHEAKVPFRLEVFELFASACGDGGSAIRSCDSLRALSQRRSIVPDVLFGVRDERGSETLGDVKTLSHSRTGYTLPRIRGDGRAVDVRAAKVNSEYDMHAILVDHKFNNCPRYETDPVTNNIRRNPNGSKMRTSHVGPVRALLHSYGPTKGFAFGSFGEASENVHSLLKTTSGLIARDNWMEMGARSQPEAEAALAARFYREWGIGNARGRARALLSVLSDTFGDGAYGRGPTAYAANLRRHHQARQYAYVYRQGPSVTPPQRRGRPN